ncbi:hypothetical protein SAMN04489752_0101 [Brevibacterium siliguriense]|uniref:Uncharacterized protein n=1 Tax=Brevibacterium siliguriense TaxID=1136497 RepID=A0A1H1LI11_9MICO|nr:hypothetical protein [Brevibacterium siliguriense]SDR73665.1 hypothetical protein SAMN04489752_0101 [Brevibacterium siliguriense]
MSIDRAELANALAEATGWSVTADPHRVTFTNDDPPQVVIWTVTDSDIGQLMYNENRRAQGHGGKRTADPGALWLLLTEALGPFDGSRGYMDGTDVTVHE